MDALVFETYKYEAKVNYMKSLKNQTLFLYVSDPWDFGTIHGCGPFLGSIIVIEMENDGLSTKSILLCLNDSLLYRDKKCKYFIASTRHEGDTLDDLKKGKNLTIALTYIPDEQALSDNPFDLSYWRGGIGLIGDITINVKD